MLASEAITKIRARINDEYDTGYTDDVLLNYINDSIKYLSHALVARNDPVLIKELTITADGTNEVPVNFVRFAGGYPVRRVGGEFVLLDGALDGSYVDTRYFYTPADLTAVTDELPFDNDTYHAIIINLASIYALNQHEYSVERDTALKQELEQIVISALGAVE